jgi:serine/threonine-protein kinase
VVDEIGIGGMASVHLARMDGPGGFQKWVAIKRIHSHLIEDESFVQMFLDEARVAARISHPNVASVIELGKHQDSYWIAMEYLHGEPLREVMRRTEELGTPMPPEIACRIIADAAEGLHAAHELQGKDGDKLDLVHRDVTPHNLFVTYDGSTKVVDFGIAKFLTRMSNTRHGTLKGKIAYMSPEQVHGEQIDRRTDLFALGVVLWELTTGKRLFRMESDLDTLAKVQECNVPKPSTIVRGYPLDLEKIVLKALAKKRDDRFRTARELSRALQGLLMRRGLFIASDEVASYMHSIFSERIQKRDAHLRWAAEVTQTINLDVGPKPDTSSALLVVAQEQGPPSDNRPAVPRPAAGAPPGVGKIPVPSKPPAYPAGHVGGIRPATGSSQAATAPRPPAGAIPTPLGGQIPSPIGGGKTGESVTANNNQPYYEDGPTIMDDPPIEADYPVGDEEEYDDTIITTTKVDNGPPGAKPLPAAGRPADHREPHRPQKPDPYNPLGYDATRPAASESAPNMPPIPGGPLVSPVAPTVPFQPPPLAVGPAGPQMLLPTVPRVAVPPEARHRGLPVWAVAVASGVIALAFLGVLYAAFSKPTAAHQFVLPPGPVPGGGPFGAARNTFTVAISPKPQGALAPGGSPLPTDTAGAAAVVAPGTPAAPVAAAQPAAARPVAPADALKPQPARPAVAPAPAAFPAASGTLSVFCRRGGRGIDCDEVLDNGRYLGAKIERVRIPVGEHRLIVRTKVPKVERVFSVYVKADGFEMVRADMDP